MGGNNIAPTIRYSAIPPQFRLLSGVSHVSLGSGYRPSGGGAITHLQVVKRVDIGSTRGEAARQGWVAFQQSGRAGDSEQHVHSALPFCFYHVEDGVTQDFVRHQFGIT